MNWPLKKKYTFRHEPRTWRNIPGKKNVAMFGSNHGGRSGKRAVPRGIQHPIGLSGRTLAMRKH